MGRKKGYVEFDRSPPDDFDPEQPYKDPVAFLEMREHIVREKWIQIEKAKILREKLRWCYRIEGVNHLQKCRHLVHQYLESTRGIGWGKEGRHPSLHGSLRSRFSFISCSILRIFMWGVCDLCEVVNFLLLFIDQRVCLGC